jgi:hypothetical protein
MKKIESTKCNKCISGGGGDCATCDPPGTAERQEQNSKENPNKCRFARDNPSDVIADFCIHPIGKEWNGYCIGADRCSRYTAPKTQESEYIITESELDTLVYAPIGKYLDIIHAVRSRPHNQAPELSRIIAGNCFEAGRMNGVEQERKRQAKHGEQVKKRERERILDELFEKYMENRVEQAGAEFHIVIGGDLEDIIESLRSQHDENGEPE